MLEKKRAIAERNLAIGCLDAMLAFGMLLVDKGLVTREEIAAYMERVISQQREQDGAQHGSRHAAAELLRQFFSAPVARDWQR